MTTLREAAQMALDALESVTAEIREEQWNFEFIKHLMRTSEALHAALAQPEQEPVAYDINGATVYIKPFVYTAPPQREWVGLTDEEIMKITGVTSADSDWNVTIVHKWIRAIEAKLREKNA